MTPNHVKQTRQRPSQRGEPRVTTTRLVHPRMDIITSKHPKTHRHRPNSPRAHQSGVVVHQQPQIHTPPHIRPHHHHLLVLNDYRTVGPSSWIRNIRLAVGTSHAVGV